MPTLLNGQRDTLNIETGRIVKDVEAKIALLDPEVSPLMTAISTLGRQYLRDENGAVKVSGIPLMKRETTSPRFEWWEDALVGTKTTVSSESGEAADATVVRVADYTILRAGDLLWNTRTNELMEVDGTPTTEDVDVRRGVGASGVGVAMIFGDELIVIGNLYPEGAISRVPKTTLEENVFNFTQITREPYSLTRTLKDTKLYTEDEWARLKAKHGVEMLKRMERTAWFSKREQGTNTVNNTDGQPKRTTGGILNHFLQTNVVSAASTLTEAEWDAFLEVAFRKGSQMKYAFCAPRVLSVIANFAKNKLQTRIDSKVYGVTIHEYQSPHGLVRLVRQPIFEESVNTNGHAVVLDLNKVKYRYLTGADVKHKENIQENDRDGVKNEYIAEFGIQLQNESEMAVLKGVQG